MQLLIGRGVNDRNLTNLTGEWQYGLRGWLVCGRAARRDKTGLIACAGRANARAQHALPLCRFP